MSTPPRRKLIRDLEADRRAAETRMPPALPAKPPPPPPIAPPSEFTQYSGTPSPSAWSPQPQAVPLAVLTRLSSGDATGFRFDLFDEQMQIFASIPVERIEPAEHWIVVHADYTPAGPGVIVTASQFACEEATFPRRTFAAAIAIHSGDNLHLHYRLDLQHA